MPACPTSCGCHTGGLNAPCTTPGGCGSAGCGRAVCSLCPTFRRNQTPRQPERAPVCSGCRRRFDLLFRDLLWLHERLRNPDPVDADKRRYERLDREGRRTGEYRWADPLAQVGGVGAIPGRTNQPHVSGSRQKTVPIDLDAVDLTAPARVPNPTDAARQWPGDQVGHLSVASRLYELVRDWRDTLWPDQHLPVATVPELVAWIRSGCTDDTPGARVDEACDRHPEIATIAEEMWDLRGWLRTALRDTDPPPRRWIGVACEKCRELSRIARDGGDEYAECGSCGQMYTDAELNLLISMLARDEQERRTAEQVAELLRR
ncbi:hypothetical protein ABZY58_11875 [Micromonospora tulbaghiae]|uniref:hypothetical protein n=1 Tax=Micromonospora tulbaghiae TaxID=479978 RepID=UPI0033ABBA4D